MIAADHPRLRTANQRNNNLIRETADDGSR